MKTQVGVYCRWTEGVILQIRKSKDGKRWQVRESIVLTPTEAKALAARIVQVCGANKEIVKQTVKPKRRKPFTRDDRIAMARRNGIREYNRRMKAGHKPK